MFATISQVLFDKNPAKALSRAIAIAAGVWCVVTVGKATVKAALRFRNERANAARQKAAEPDKVAFFCFPVADEKSLFSLSAPCDRVALFLKSRGIPHERVVTYDASGVNPQTERLPVVELKAPGEDAAQQFTDSRFIIERLERHFHCEDALDAAQAHKLNVLECIISSMRLGYGRATYVDNLAVVVDFICKHFPTAPPKAAVKLLLAPVRASTIAMLNMHGYGDLSDAQFHQTFLGDAKSLAECLAETKFAVTDDMPTRADFLVFPWVRLIRKYAGTRISENSPAFAFVSSCEIFTKYVENCEVAFGLK